jgi:gamma-glutamyl:cysteine ligase YbdK (ATP-grasp superfamily)
MQLLQYFFITVNGLHVSGGFSAHHQELKNCTYIIWYVPRLLAATAPLAVAASKLSTYQMMYVQFLSS